MRIDLNEFRTTFFEEAAERRDEMEAALLRLDHDPADQEALNAAFRAAHTIKGSSSMLDLESVGRLTHGLEEILERMRGGTVAVTAGVISLLLKCTDTLGEVLAAVRENKSPPGRVEEAIKDLTRFRGAAVPVPPPAAADPSPPAPEAPTGVTYRVSFEPNREVFLNGMDPLLFLRELDQLGTVLGVDVDPAGVPPLADLVPDRCYLRWALTLRTTRPRADIDDVFCFVRDEFKINIDVAPDPDGIVPAGLAEPARPGEAAPPGGAGRSGRPGGEPAVRVSPQDLANGPAPAGPAAKPAKDRAESETVRVDRDRLDKLINVIGELVISEAMVEQDFAQLRNAGGRESRSLSQLSKIVRDLQELSLSLRMVPVGGTFQRMARIVRDLARKLDKEIRFETEGEETELDKTVVDQIGDPLLHMIRNAVDHGIEPPADRVRAGKPGCGVIRLRAYHQGGNIYIELKDDGRGLDRQAILRKAAERGLVRAGEPLTDAEICDLIFLPGFSTAKAVTDVSGRGVGMDVVRRNVEALQGSVSIRSDEGKGSTVTIRLPLTLAILDGLSVGLNDEVYILPLLSVVESFRPKPAEIKRVLGRGEVVLVRGEVVPLLRLGTVLATPARAADPSDGLVVIVEDQGKKCGLLVDDLVGQQQVVIKNLEANFEKVEGFAGATILGDGRVALILDIYGLTRMANRGAEFAALPAPAAPVPTLP